MAKHATKAAPAKNTFVEGNMSGFYVYENWTNKRARVHRASCSYCNGGRGSQASTGDKNGEWHGPFVELDQARIKLATLDYSDRADCGVCILGGRHELNS